MESDRPYKRQKLANERNPFIDDEAVVDREDPEESGEEEGTSILDTEVSASRQILRTIDGFIENEYEVDDGYALHAQVNAAIRAEESEEHLSNDVQMYESDLEDDEEHREHIENEDVNLSPADGVWEIRCKVSVSGP